VIAAHYSQELRRRILASNEGFSRESWERFAELGLLALNVPQEQGGLGAGAVETLLVSMAIGAGLVIEPYLTSAVVGTRAIARAASAAQGADWLPRMAAGELIVVLAHDEAGAGPDASDIQTRATPSDGGWILSGRKSVVYHAPIADLLLISARLSAGDDAAVGLFAVRPGTAGLALQPFTTVDEQLAAEVTLADVPVGQSDRLGGDVREELADVLDYGTAALCAEALGALDRLLTMTSEYSRTRVQFGVPIGTFQALRHRLADMLIHLEQARSMVYLAASRCDSSAPVERSAAISAAKVIVGQAARFVGQQAVQLHGGMGVSDEFAISHYFKRLLAAATRFGSTPMHLERYARGL
jgi:alkylation response protein AidB-like acyl-CoA dehydrogenase